MEKLGEYAQEESPDTETRELPREPMLEEEAASSSELLQTVKDLKTKMESVKKENERILKTQEELNQILIEKIQTEGRSRRSESEDVSHQRRSKKMKLEKLKAVHHLKGSANDKVTTLLVTIVRLSCMTERRSIDHMKRFPGSLKK